MSTVPIPGSRRSVLPGATAIGATHGEEILEVTVRLRRRAELPAAALDGVVKPAARTYMSHDELAARHGADPADIAKVVAFASAAGLAVVHTSAARRSVFLSGTAAAFEKAFEVTLEDYEHPHKGTFRGRVGEICVPADLAEIVVGVFGLDNRAVAKPHISRQHVGLAVPSAGFSPNQVAQFYNFPPRLDGDGQTVGILELGGGYRPADIAAYFAQIGLPMPHVRAVSVDHGRNTPTTAGPLDNEVMLDIEVVAAVAPKAKIVVYFTANMTERDYLDALTKAVHDTVHKPSILSISWGGPENAVTEGFQQQLNEVMQSAAALGITVTVAAGDSGAADEGPKDWDGGAHTDFPASCPFVLACGGTRIAVSGSHITAESVWNQHDMDTQDSSFGSGGGGVSTLFPVPDYQKNAGIPNSVATGKPGRGVPDVAGNADPASGYQVRVDGQEFAMGGTSAVAPLWAGLIARINQSLGKQVGFINPILYANPSVFNDITLGNNRVGVQNVGYDAGPGWDACTGLGSPNGVEILNVLK